MADQMSDLQAEFKDMQGVGRDRTPEEEDPAAGKDTGGLGQALDKEIDDLDMEHHKGQPEQSRPDLVPNEGKAIYEKNL